MNVKYIFSIIFFFLFVSSVCQAQQEILYTQYVYNELTINPAYAGYHDALNVTLNSRKQWIGLEGSPMTMTLAGHMALDRKNTECDAFRIQKNGGMKRNTTHNNTALGLLVYNDRIGVDNTLQANLAYAYKIIFNGGRLSFGLQGSVVNYAQDFVDLDKNNMDDPVFNQNIQKTMVNFGTGVFFDNDRFYLGFSEPQIMKNYLDNSTSDASRQLRQYFFTGGYLLYINRFFKFKPSFMFRYTEEIPFQLDINSMVIYNDNLYFGLSYRNKNTIITIFQMDFAERLRIGLAYDYNILNEFKKAANGTVEVLLSYNFRSSVHKIINPRYF